MTFSYISIEEYYAEIESRPMPNHIKAFARLTSIYENIYVIKDEKGCHKILSVCSNDYSDRMEVEITDDGIIFARPFLSIEGIQVFTTSYELCVGYKKATGFGCQMSEDLSEITKSVGWHPDLYKMIKNWFQERQAAEYLNLEE